MYDSSYSDRSVADKMMKLFIIQAISGFVTRDYDTGLHYLNEVKTHYAQNQSNLNNTLKGLAKEIIQSLDMFAPGATSDQFKDMVFQEDYQSQPTTEKVFHSPTDEFKSILNRRKKRQKSKIEDDVEESQESGDNLFGTLGDLDLSSIEDRKVETNTPTTPIFPPQEDPQEPQFYEEPTPTNQKLTKEQIEDNKILEILLKRKKQRGNLTPEDEEVLELMAKKREEESLSNNPIEKVRRRRRSRKSRLWDD